MSKVKTFRFTGSRTNYIGSGRGHECIKDDSKYIDKVINDFICNNVYELIDIKITTVECRWHNNGGFNDIDLIYTIIYV